MSEKSDKETIYEELTGESGIVKFGELIKHVRTAMLSTIAEDGSISSRPMAMQDKPFGGVLWFLTRFSSEKVDELSKAQKVTLAFVEPKDSIYVALKGTATVSQDRAKIEELWNPMHKAWFPGGPTDPQIAVLQVHVHEAIFGRHREAASFCLPAMRLQLSQVARYPWAVPGMSKCLSVVKASEVDWTEFMVARRVGGRSTVRLAHVAVAPAV